MKAIAALLVVAASYVFVACDDESSGSLVVQTPATVGAEKTFGTINHLPGGVATVTSDYVLQSITCDNGTLVLVTTNARFVGTMDCTAQVPQETIDRFIGKPIMITITETRLKIEHPEAGSLDYPATGVAIEDI